MFVTLLYWLPAGVYMAAIFVLSSMGNLGAVPAGVSDKSLHMLGYAGLGVVMLFGFARGRLGAVTWRRAIAAVVLATLYGVTDEWHQSFVPGRTPDVLDIAADLLGASLGVAAVSLLAALRAWSILKSPSHSPGRTHARGALERDTPP